MGQLAGDNLLSVKKSLLTGLLVGFCSVLLTYLNLLGSLENRTLDLRFFLRGTEAPADNILIVGITETCLRELGRWPWERDLHAELLEQLTTGKAAAIGMDIIFAELSPDASMDRALVEATRNAPPVVYSTDAPPGPGSIPGFLAPSSLTYPIPELTEYAQAGYINVTPDSDGVLRRFIMWMEQGGKPIASFGILTWALGQNIDMSALNAHLEQSFQPEPKELRLGAFSFPLDGGGRTLINYSGGPGAFPVLPYHLVLKREYHPSTFQDKIVLVGYYAPGLGDYYFTPFQRDTPMHGVEVHANIIHTLAKSGPVRQLPLAATLGLVFSMALFSALLYRTLHPLPGFIGCLFLALVFLLVTTRLFATRSLYVESVYPILALFGSYLGNMGYRLVQEQKDRLRVTGLFSRYVAPQVVNEILNLKKEELKLSGTKRYITVLFVDVRGFTSLSEQLPPEEVVAILNQYFDIVTQCLFKNQGTVDKFMGDAAMALFNAPLLLEDHALWAARAALEIMEQGRPLITRIQKATGAAIDFGIGISSGYAVVGSIGSMNRLEYTAIGDTVNIASRLENSAGPGQILVSEAFCQEIAGRMPLEPAGEILTKGKTRPIVTYQLINSSAR